MYDCFIAIIDCASTEDSLNWNCVCVCVCVCVCSTKSPQPVSSPVRQNSALRKMLTSAC